ncbi:MAG: PAS domain S-box protein [Methanoregulaceae archaeon]|nr:MAG: PAS domain S-box protein [Methanoregulaceae archaeon]
MNSDPFKTACLLIIPLFLLIIAALSFLNIKTVFEPPLLLAVMNTLFLGIIPVYIAFVAYRTSRINGSFAVLLLGSGMLVFGLGAIAAGWLNGLPNGSNITPTIHNVSVLIGSAFFLASVLLAVVGEVPSTKKAVQSVTIVAYGGAVVFEVLLIFSAILGLLPPFFVPGTGPSVLRQVILSNAAEIYALAAILFFYLYGKKRDDFFFWFSLSFGLVATGLLAVLVQPAVGSMVGWAGRIAQYLGACFALVAIQAARESATRSGISVPAQFGTFFGRGAATSAILAAARESIWLFGTDDTILMANPTALARLGGRSDREVIGHRYQEFMSKELATSRRARLEEVMRTKEPVRFEDERNGILFDHSFYPVFDEDGTVTGIAAFSRDITDVKSAEDALSGINEELTATQEELQKNLDELVRNEQKLRESEERYRTVADFTLDWEFWFGPDGTFIYVSPSADQILGRPVGTFTSVDLFLHEVVHPEDLSLRLAHLKDELSGKGPSELEYRIVRPDGEVRWIHHICRPIRDPSGRFLGTRGSNRDITERRRVKEALKVAEEKSRLIIASAPAMIYETDPSGSRFLSVNDPMCSMLGYTREELMAMKPADLLDDTSRQQFADRIRRSLAGETLADSVEYHGYTKDGNEMYVSVKTALISQDGKPERAIVVGHDITPRKRAEQALEESEDRMRFALETSHTGAWDLDLTDHTARRSLEHDRVFGYTTLLPGWTYEMFLDHVLPEDRASVDAKFRHATETGGDWNFECRIRRTDGEIRWIWAAGRHRTGSPGSLARIAGIVQDITGRKLAEEALKKAHEELEIRVEERTLALQQAIAALSTERHRLYDVLEGLPAYVCLLDADYRMPFANKTFREWFAEPGGRRCYEFLFNRTEPCENCETYTVMQTRAPHHRYWSGPNGRDYDIYDFPFTDTDGSSMILEMGIDITERNKAEEERSNLASIVQNSDDAIIGKSLDGTIMSWNTGAERMYGYSAEEATGRNISMLLPPGREDDLADILNRIRNGTPVHHYETVRVRNDGSKIQVSLTISPILDRNGALIGASTIARDITEQKNTEIALRKANLYNRSLIEASLDPLVTISPDGTISDVNEATIRATGYTRGEVVGTDFSDYFTDTAKAKAGYEAAFRDGSVTDYPLGIRHRNGQVTPVLYNAAVYRDAEGKITGVFAAARDITGQKKAEEALRKAHDFLEVRVEERTAELAETNTHLQNEIEVRRNAEEALRETSQYLEKLITYANAPIIVWDREFRITRFNHAAEILTGRKAEEITGTRIENLFPQKHVHEVMDLIRRTMTGEQLNIVELPVLHRSGSVRVVLWNSASLYGPDQKTLESTIAQGQDITVRKRAEAELLRKNEELSVLNEEITATQEELQQNVDELHRSEEALRKNEADLREALSEKEVLLAEIHHRVKNNLTAFISLLSLEGSYEESPAGLALKKDLQNRARSMALIHETLYRTGKYSSVRMSMYLSTLVGQIAGSFDPEQTVRIVISGDSVSIDLARATPCGLIVNELVTNSFKYAFPASFDCRKIRGASCTVTVNIAEEGDWYVLNVLDNGIGLPAEFDVRHARSLGLKLVNFLAKHQLRATVEVRSGEGTAFELRFPVNQQHGRDS